jgi:putative transposase
VYVGGRPAEELWREEPIKRIRRRAQALRTKVQAVRRDVHRKICRFLCDNFDTIFLPKLDTVSLSAVGGGTSSQTVRNMMTFAHGEFRVFLEAYAKVRGVTVVHPSGLHNQDVHRLWLC